MKIIEELSNQPIVLTQRFARSKNEKRLTLPLSAEERTKLRGIRTTACGLEVLLQLPREGPLLPGEILCGDYPYPKIQVEAAIEQLIQVQSQSLLELIKAAYHLGNRHVDLELQDRQLFLLKDPVLEKLLLRRGLTLKIVKKPFYPEVGAYPIAHNTHLH